MKECESLTVQILSASHAIEERLETALEPLGLSLAKLGVLDKLAVAGEPLPLGTLADRCACVRSNITQLIDRLEADRLVARAADPRDRRSIRAELTEAGRSRHAEGIRALRHAEDETLALLQPTDRQELLRLLGVLAEAS